MVTATVGQGKGLTYTLDAGSCAQKTPCQATLSVTPATSGRFDVDLTSMIQRLDWGALRR